MSNKNKKLIRYAFLEKKRKAQISEVMTWVVATVVILSILIIFIYASSLLAQKTKTVKAQNLRIDLGNEINLLETKNLIAYSSASEAKRNIIERWEEDKEKDENE